MNRCAIMINKQNQTAILVEAARLYYEHHFSQQQIALKLGISRPGVSRLLRQARDKGIVKIEIVDLSKLGTNLENKLKDKFSLKRVVIAPNDNEDIGVIKKRLGVAAAALLNEMTDSLMILGVSWGTTMLEVARHINKKHLKDMIVVQLNGGVSRAEYDTHASEVAQKIGEAYSAIPYLLPLPAIVDKEDVKRAIISDKNIAHTMQIAREAKVAMFTIGSFGYDSVLVKSNYFESEEVDTLLKRGAVGDICSRIINYNGEICSEDLNSRTIGIELNELQKKEYSIAVAGGKEKLPAIQAALNGKLFNVLVTDEWVANKLLSEN
ncbi:sugar-binding transcriptional regulator [bacterium]|nr:sugar-binding transcriptional regulator [bacterium]